MVASQTALRSHQLGDARNGVRLKTIALPAEHGGWGFLFEPVALGLLLAPSIAGFFLALSATGFFLARQPLTLLVVNRKRQSPRTGLAKRIAAIYLAIGLVLCGAALFLTQHSFMLPLFMAAPFAFVQVAYEWSGRRRVLIAELAGAVAISSLASAIAFAGGWSTAPALALWLIVIARAAPAILYVRAAIGRLHGRSSSILPTVFSHAAGASIAFLLVSVSLIPKLAIVAMWLLLLRSLLFLVWAMPHRFSAKTIGISEVAFGALTVLAIVSGKAWGW